MTVFELQGVNFINKGAELMLLAIVEHFSSLKGAPRLAMPFRIGSAAQRNQVKIGHLMALHREPPMLNSLLDISVGLLPAGVRDNYGLYAPSHMSGLIDAAGFRYSDQWSISSLKIQAEKTRRYKNKGKPVIFLPQAFGPFKSSESQNLMRTVIENSDIVFARDATSFDHLITAAGTHLPQICRAPDFTNLIQPRFEGETLSGDTLIVVPNSRMLDKTGPEVAERYIHCLSTAVVAACDHGLQPMVMVHDAEGDRAIAERLQKQVGRPLPELGHRDPRVLKGWLSQACGVVGSRFHALVGALSSNTPAIALGWSHKYGELMNDYGQAHLNLTVSDEVKIAEAIEMWANPGERQKAVDTISRHSADLKRDARAMWSRVDEIISPMV